MDSRDFSYYFLVEGSVRLFCLTETMFEVDLLLYF